MSKSSPVALVADDEDSIVSLLEFLLPGIGVAEVLAAHDGDEAAALVTREGARLDLALLDVRMPGPSGLELLARLRAEHPKVPVVILSGDRGDRTDAIGAGARLFVVKPFSVAELSRELGRLLSEA